MANQKFEDFLTAQNDNIYIAAYTLLVSMVTDHELVISCDNEQAKDITEACWKIAAESAVNTLAFHGCTIVRKAEAESVRVAAKDLVAALFADDPYAFQASIEVPTAVEDKFCWNMELIGDVVEGVVSTLDNMDEKVKYCYPYFDDDESKGCAEDCDNNCYRFECGNCPYHN